MADFTTIHRMEGSPVDAFLFQELSDFNSE